MHQGRADIIHLAKTHPHNPSSQKAGVAVVRAPPPSALTHVAYEISCKTMRRPRHRPLEAPEARSSGVGGSTGDRSSVCSGRTVSQKCSTK
jgi:hypothetical protein